MTKSLLSEEPDEGKPCPDAFSGFMSGSVLAAGLVMALPTIIRTFLGCNSCTYFYFNVQLSI